MQPAVGKFRDAGHRNSCGTNSCGAGLVSALEILVIPVQQRPDINRFHPSGPDGLHSQFGIFIGSAMLGSNTEAPSRFQKDIRSGLLPKNIFAGNDGFEQVPDPQVIEHLADAPICAT